MSLSKSRRFEILKRDRFTCAYCGRTPPEVLLHVDHIIPRADGGPDDDANLITACQECNLGKGARSLDARIKPGPTSEEIRERIEQAQAYLDLLGSMRDARQQINDRLLDLVNEAWAKAWGGGQEEQDDGTYWVMPDGGYWPDKRSVLNILRRLPIESVYEAVEITAGRFPVKASYDATRYFYGVCWRMIRELGT